VRDGKIYMLRTYANATHEIWDVTNPSHPVGVRTVAGCCQRATGVSGDSAKGGRRGRREHHSLLRNVDLERYAMPFCDNDLDAEVCRSSPRKVSLSA
jgi:hypothetical protein